MDPQHAPYPFDRVTVRSRISGGGTRISWTFDEMFQDPLPHTFTLQGSRSSVSTATWTNIGSAATNTDHLVDGEDRLFADEQDYQYRVKLVTTKGTYYSPGVGADNRLDFRDWRIARDVIRKETLRHDRYTSLPGWLLKRRKEGPKCPLCLDPVGNPDDSRCPRCFGTRYDGGYFAGEFTYLQLEVNADNIDTDPQLGTIQNSNTIENCRMLGDPTPQTRDVFVDGKTDRRYMIETIVSSAVIRSYPVVTTIILRPVGLGDIIYDFETPDDLPESDRDLLTPGLA